MTETVTVTVRVNGDHTHMHTYTYMHTHIHAQDEVLEVTPKQVRMRKRELDANKRHTNRRDKSKNK